jgi:hypothetical protein
MKIKPTMSNRVDPSKLGIEIENEELEKINASREKNDGVIDLAEVYEPPVKNIDTGSAKTLTKYLDREGLEFTEKQYQREYQLKAAHQIIINGGSTAQISQALSISLHEAKQLKRELTARQISAVKNINVEHKVAKAVMFYDHVGAKALQLANKQPTDARNSGTIMRNQIEALKVALQSQTDKQKFLHLAGLYETGLRSGDDNKHATDASNVRDMLTGILSGDTYEVVAEEEDLDDGVEVF